MSNRFFLRYSVVGVAIICFLLLIAIRNQPKPGKGVMKSGHFRNNLKHNKHNLNLGRQKAGRQPQGMDTYKDFKEEPEEMSYEDYSSYFDGSSYSVSISSSFYGNNSRVHTSFSSSSDSYVNEGDANFLEQLKQKHKLKRLAKIKRKKEQRAKKLGAPKNLEFPETAKMRLKNGNIIDENGMTVGKVGKKERKHKTATSRKGRSTEVVDVIEWEDFTEKVELQQKERLDGMKSYCSGRERNATLSEYTKKHILVIPEYRLLYCFVPKAGCSNWKRIMMVLTGQRDSVDGLTSDEVHLRAKFQFFSGLPLAKQIEALESYYKFTFVRDPMNRLLSVYRNKFGDKVYYRKNKAFHSYAKGIIQHFRPNATNYQKTSGEGVTWTEFSKYLLSPQVRKKYESGRDVYHRDHWEVQTKICSPCDVGYDFIGHLETIDDDAIYLLRHWGVQDKVQYLSRNTSRPTNSTDLTVFDRNFGLLTQEQKDRMYGIFKEDYAAFGYDKPSFIP